MELQLVAHVSTNEDGETIPVKKITVDEKDFLIVGQGDKKNVISLVEMKEAISKLEDFDDS